jgi:hypothetical protein
VSFPNVAAPCPFARQETLKWWRFHILTTTFHFKVVQGDEALFWIAAEEREDMRSRFAAIVRTAIQRIIEIGRYKSQREQRCGKISAAAVAKLYVENLKLGDGAEPITEKYVSIALRISETLLSVRSVKDVIFALEGLLDHAGPFNSIYRLETLSELDSGPDLNLVVLSMSQRFAGRCR